MIPVGKLLLSAFTVVIAFGFWRLFPFIYRQLKSPIRRLRGPKRTSWIFGHLRDIWVAERSTLQEEWVKKYGRVLKYKGFFNVDRLFTMDMRAIHHVLLTHDSNYQKPPLTRSGLARIFGEGLIVVEGAQHRRQKHILNPAFGPAQIRALTHIFFDKAIRLRDLLSTKIAKDPSGHTAGTRLDIMPWVNRATLDVLGLAGFNYDFDALTEELNEQNEAFICLSQGGQQISFLTTLQGILRLFRLIPNDRTRRLRIVKRTLARVCKEMLSVARSAALTTATEKGEIEKSNMQGRDLLSLLVKSNMANDIPESQRLSDKEVLAQLHTFLLAGHETTSTAIVWALYSMSKEPRIQTKLREELLSVHTDTPSMDELMSLPYLDGLVRETLRLHSPNPQLLRMALNDDVLPVEKPYTDKYGVTHDSIRVNKGDTICIPTLAIHRSEELWGPNVLEFKPERWESIPEGVSQIRSLWGHLLTFGSGPRACIGYRFALTEMKAILFTLIRTFEFELAVPDSEIGAKATVVQRPVLRSDPKYRPQLLLLLKPYKQG